MAEEPWENPEALRRRERAYKKYAAFLECKTDEHPFGYVGRQDLLPTVLTSNTWDTRKTAWRWSEWGNAAGMT